MKGAKALSLDPEDILDFVLKRNRLDAKRSQSGTSIAKVNKFTSSKGGKKGARDNYFDSVYEDDLRYEGY